ncbi:MAG: tRNA pseudouridine(55) synthase TruB [Fimbriimonadaceae bacterium]
MLGILILDKPTGVTSHDVVQTVRRRFGTRRVGHAGTLAPLATGVLVAAVGPATRFLQYLPLEPKKYRVKAVFGATTPTYDRESAPESGGPLPVDLQAALEDAIPDFEGAIEQLPPLYSAVKRAGRPLYEYARKGEVVERPSRRVFIESLVLKEVGATIAELDIVCSGGTYVRSIVHDLGQALGCGAYVEEIQRTAVGRYGLPDAVSLDQAGPESMLPLAEALEPMPSASLNDGQVERIRHGQFVLDPGAAEGPFVALLDPGGTLVGVSRREGNQLLPECVIPVMGVD